MPKKIEFIIPKNKPSFKGDALFSDKVAKTVIKFHSQIPGYKKTPLAVLKNYAASLGLKNVYVKDESYRFNLNAFKVLGGSFAVANVICQRLGLDINKTTFSELISPAIRKKLGSITLASTTDGNHGRGIAWAAEQLKQKCVINMPRGSTERRVKAIEGHGATVKVLDMNYDEAVRYTDEQAKKHGWIIVQDTAWEGYTDIPTWIMQGYLTMVSEAVEQMSKCKEVPTHVFIQSGVGAMSGAVISYLYNHFGLKCPKIISVEPTAAGCVFASAKKNGDKPVAITGDIQSISAGLCCGEVNPLSWNVLRTLPSLYVQVSDEFTANGMRILGNPLMGDDRVISGESGAIGLGILDYIMKGSQAKKIREHLKLDSKSSVLLFSTEGDTDPEMYRKICWYGKLNDDI